MVWLAPTVVTAVGTSGPPDKVGSSVYAKCGGPASARAASSKRAARDPSSGFSAGLLARQDRCRHQSLRALFRHRGSCVAARGRQAPRDLGRNGQRTLVALKAQVLRWMRPIELGSARFDHAHHCEADCLGRQLVGDVVVALVAWHRVHSVPSPKVIRRMTSSTSRRVRSNGSTSRSLAAAMGARIATSPQMRTIEVRSRHAIRTSDPTSGRAIIGHQ